MSQPAHTQALEGTSSLKLQLDLRAKESSQNNHYSSESRSFPENYKSSVRSCLEEWLVSVFLWFCLYLCGVWNAHVIGRSHLGAQSVDSGLSKSWLQTPMVSYSQCRPVRVIYFFCSGIHNQVTLIVLSS